MKNLINEFNAIDKMKIFEIAVIDKRTSEREYIIFDIELQKRSLIAQHEALNTRQSKSKKIAFIKIVLDPIFSIDENLQSLYEECKTAILESEFFELAED